MREASGGAMPSGSVAPGSTRRRAVASVLAAIASVAASNATGEAKGNTGKRRKKRKKNSRKRRNESPSLQKANVALGVYLPRALDDSAVLTEFHRSIGRSLEFVIWYEGWSRGNFDNAHRQYLATYDTWNMTPVISWGPFDPQGPTIAQPAYRLSNISRGDFNGYIDSWAAGLKAYGKPVYVRFAHEMNGNWFPWGVGVNGNGPGDFVAAWRHIHDRFASKGATNVRWIWNPNVVYDSLPASLADVYPGHQYVDWVGMNGYNWGTSVYWASCPCQSTWEPFAKVFDRTYHELTALADKPIFIGEFASSEAGGNKAAWIRDALVEQLPATYPRVQAISWFSSIATGLDTIASGEVVPTAEVDWRIASSRASRDAFADAVKAPYYQATLG